MRRVLMIAYHYPPVRVSSGVHRTLAFSRHLPAFGWTPLVLTAHPRAYEAVDPGQMQDIPAQATVVRAQAFDTARHLAPGGRYLRWMAMPDRWVSWWPAGVLAGLRMVRRYRPKLLWSTYPIATAHLIGLSLSRLTGLPWIADFRDSMTEEGYPTDLRQRQVYRWIERRTVRRAARAVFTTPSAVRMYRERYPKLPESRWQEIPNGFDEDSFAEAERTAGPRVEAAEPTVLVHSGVLYPSERDPRPFFAALGALRSSGAITPAGLRVVLRATGHDHLFRPMLGEYGIEDVVSLEPPVGYRAALAEMLAADGLLIFQASNCNHQVPAKLYEYLRARRPILALTDPGGDTAATLRQSGIDTIVALDDREAIERELPPFLARVRAKTAPRASDAVIESYSRRAGARQLAGLLDHVERDAR